MDAREVYPKRLSQYSMHYFDFVPTLCISFIFPPTRRHRVVIIGQTFSPSRSRQNVASPVKSVGQRHKKKVIPFEWDILLFAITWKQWAGYRYKKTILIILKNSFKRITEYKFSKKFRKHIWYFYDKAPTIFLGKKSRTGEPKCPLANHWIWV